MQRAWTVGFVILLIGLTTLLEGFSFSLLVPITQSLSAGAAVPNAGAGLFGAYDQWLTGYTESQRLAVLGLALVGLFGLKNALQFLRELASNRLWLGISAELRSKSLASALERPYRYFLDHKQGMLVQRLYNETHHLAYLVRTGIEQVADILAVGVLVGLLILVSWKVSLLLLGVGLVYGVVMWLFAPRARAIGDKRLECEGEAVALLSETVAGIRQIKVFSAERRIHGIYDNWVQRFRDLEIKHWLNILLPQRATEMFWVVVLGLLLSLPALDILGDPSSVLPLVAVFTAVAFRIGPYLSRISQGWLTMKYYLPAFYLVGKFMETPKQVACGTTGRPFHVLSSGIRLEHVSFLYGGHQYALSDVSVCFKRGETTAVIGPSGGGKSTLVDLLVRLYDPTQGRIMVDDVDLREYDPGSWLAAIGFVSQDTFIFHGSIQDNIAFGRPEASLEEIHAAARAAHAHAFIEQLPHGYSTVVGDRGLKLSGGQRQRIAIARALVRNPQVLIFDEATSALDNQSEAMVQEAIAAIAKTRTVILVAHRLSTVVHADKIVVLECGRVMEEGTHSALLRAGGVYAGLYGREESRW